MIYLDNAATSWPKAPGTAEALAEALNQPMGNPGRSSHAAGISADRILFELRESLADLFRIKDSGQIILNSGATEALNTVFRGFLKPGMRVLCSSMEHNAVMRPLRELEESLPLTLERFPSDPASGYPDMQSFLSALDHKPDLLVVTAASNINGIIFPLEEMADAARRKGIPLCVDAAQGAGEIPLYPEEWQIDFLCFAGHKGLLGPAGTGGLYIRNPDNLEPLIYGGTGSGSRSERQPLSLPDRFESGTPNIPGCAGLFNSLRYFSAHPALSHTADMNFQKLVNGINEVHTLEPVGRGKDNTKKFTRVLSLRPTDKERSISDLTAFLDDREIAVRAGLHCAPSAHKTLGSFETGTVRLSPGLFTTEEDIDRVLAILKEFE